MRFLSSVVCLGVLAIGLTGCAAGSTAPSETMLRMPESPAPEDTAIVPDPGSSAGSTPTDGPGTVRPSEHCVMVAGGMTAAVLAPLGLRAGTAREDEAADFEQQLLDLRDKVPAELHDNFTELARSVEHVSEGTGEFDEDEFRRAMEPVEQWLDQHCSED